jgi:hypothetical protein
MSWEILVFPASLTLNVAEVAVSKKDTNPTVPLVAVNSELIQLPRRRAGDASPKKWRKMKILPWFPMRRLQIARCDVFGTRWFDTASTFYRL